MSSQEGNLVNLFILLSEPSFQNKIRPFVNSIAVEVYKRINQKNLKPRYRTSIMNVIEQNLRVTSIKNISWTDCREEVIAEAQREFEIFDVEKNEMFFELNHVSTEDDNTSEDFKGIHVDDLSLTSETMMTETDYGGSDFTNSKDICLRNYYNLETHEKQEVNERLAKHFGTNCTQVKILSISDLNEGQLALLDHMKRKGLMENDKSIIAFADRFKLDYIKLV